MDFSALMSAASSNAVTKKLASGTIYSSKLPPVKKLPKAAVKRSVIEALLKQKDEDKRKKVQEDQQRLAENLPKVRKRKSGLDELKQEMVDNAEKIREKEQHRKGAEGSKKMKKSSKSGEAAGSKGSEAVKGNNSKDADGKGHNSVVRESSSDGKKHKRDRAQQQKQRQRPALDFASLLSMAQDNTRSVADNSNIVISVEQLMQERQSQGERERPLTQRQIEEAEHRKRRRRREMEEREARRRRAAAGEMGMGDNQKTMGGEDSSGAGTTDKLEDSVDSGVRPKAKDNSNANKIKNNRVANDNQHKPKTYTGDSIKEVVSKSDKVIRHVQDSDHRSTTITKNLSDATMRSGKTKQDIGRTKSLREWKEKRPDAAAVSDVALKKKLSKTHNAINVDDKKREQMGRLGRKGEVMDQYAKKRQQQHVFADLARGSSRHLQPERVVPSASIRSKYDSYFNEGDEGEGEEEESDMDDFIDDGDEGVSNDISREIREIFGRNRSREQAGYSDAESDGSDMEASYADILREEARSAKLAQKEDLEDMRLEEQHKRKKMMKKKKIKKKKQGGRGR